MYVGDLQNKGCAVVMDPEKDKTMVEFLLQFKDDTELLLRDAFQKNEAFAYSCKRAFEKVVNCKEGRPAELIGGRLPA
jgi:cullin 4